MTCPLCLQPIYEDQCETVSFLDAPNVRFHADCVNTHGATKAKEYAESRYPRLAQAQRRSVLWSADWDEPLDDSIVAHTTNDEPFGNSHE